MTRIFAPAFLAVAFAAPAFAGPEADKAEETKTPPITAAAAVVIETPDVDALPKHMMDRISAAAAGKTGDNEKFW